MADQTSAAMGTATSWRFQFKPQVSASTSNPCTSTDKNMERPPAPGAGGKKLEASLVCMSH
jgi:hypothetical protein